MPSTPSSPPFTTMRPQCLSHAPIPMALSIRTLSAASQQPSSTRPSQRISTPSVDPSVPNETLDLSPRRHPTTRLFSRKSVTFGPNWPPRKYRFAPLWTHSRPSSKSHQLTTLVLTPSPPNLFPLPMAWTTNTFHHFLTAVNLSPLTQAGSTLFLLRRPPTPQTCSGPTLISNPPSNGSYPAALSSFTFGRRPQPPSLVRATAAIKSASPAPFPMLMNGGCHLILPFNSPKVNAVT
jgi:hypothetical protein